MSLVSESNVKGKVRNLLKKYPQIKAIAYPQGLGGHVGTPDRLMCLTVEITEKMVGRRVGLLGWVEVKRPTVRDGQGKIIQRGGEVSPKQAVEILDWQSRGVPVMVIDNTTSLQYNIEAWLQSVATPLEGNAQANTPPEQPNNIKKT